MYTEAKKLHLIEEVLKIKNEFVLKEIEAIVNRAKSVKKEPKPSAHDFSGLLSEKDASLMEAAIQEGCEQVNPDDWK
jgi:hypothetical protein